MTKNSVLLSLLQINAIKLDPANPFTWASGWKSPIYCDNRKTLSFPTVRNLIAEGFQRLIIDKYPNVDVIAGVATGAIAHGMLVADRLNLPFIYVRSAPKKHGLENLVEGDVKAGQKVVVVEDLISTGLSSLAAVDALRNAGYEVLGMVAIFTYGFNHAAENFKQSNVELNTLASYSEMIEIAIEQGFVNKNHLELLKSWRNDPENWGK
ncbi:MAG: orotate phosphoribosyltransferase [Bacteroidales bacterium]|nr:MAG: orotate phosphoribosyltransferase [Bacteroidales bacterium]